MGHKKYTPVLSGHAIAHIKMGRNYDPEIERDEDSNARKKEISTRSCRTDRTNKKTAA
jgi:hypothetical protein